MATLPSSRAINIQFWGLGCQDKAYLSKLKCFVFKALLYSHYSKLSRLGAGNIDFNENLSVNFELTLVTTSKGLSVDCLQFIILPVSSHVVFVSSTIHCSNKSSFPVWVISMLYEPFKIKAHSTYLRWLSPFSTTTWWVWFMLCTLLVTTLMRLCSKQAGNVNGVWLKEIID